MQTKQITVLAMLSAVACVVMLLIRINFMPAAPFLIYDPKDIIIVIGGFLYGPFAVVLMSLIVSLVEMVTVSGDGWVGFAMNVISSCAFACPAAIIYRKNRTLKGAVIGLVAGWLFVTAVMILWNFIVTPPYRGIPRQAIVPLLFTVFMPFNLIKYGIGAATAMLVYKPLSTTLKRMNIIEKSENQAPVKGSIIASIILAICLAAIPGILLVLVMQGYI